MVQALVRRKSRLRVKGLKVKDREKIKEAIAISIQNGSYTTRAIGTDVGKDHSTISRYLAEMEREGTWGIKRDANGNIVISLQKQIAQQYQELDKEPFNQLPSIQKWIIFLKSGKIPTSRIGYVLSIVHGISDQLKVMPETIVSYGVPIDLTKRKEIAIEYWQNFLAWFNTAYPQMQRAPNCTGFFERIELRSIILSQPKWTKQELVDRLRYISEQDPNLVDPPVLDAVNESEEAYIMQVIEDMRQAAKKQATTLEEIKLEEFRELKSAATHGYPPDPTEQNPQFQINKDDVRNDVKWNSLNLRVAPIENLRVVMVQRGYHRLGSGAGQRRIDTFYDDGHNKWYPGVEQYGEGLFIDAGKSELEVADEDWMKICRSRSEVLCHPVFVWWHTLSHRIISALSIDSGYSSASIRERVYIDVDPATRIASGGIVLYATQPGGDGSMGGLIALVPHFGRILESAARNLNSCSNDPLCSEAKISAGSSNGAACYACLLLSETSCEHRNMYLDRNLLRSQP